jgi:chorismate mutase/prephenate dehydratase
MAAIQTFGLSSNLVPADSIHDVFMAVQHGHADYGIVPVENSVGGIVPETLDMFPQTSVKICAELYLRIHHHLLSLAPSLDAVQRVYAGPQPEMQCRKWLRSNLKHAELVETVPTARAAQRALEDQEGAAIANMMTAESLGLPVLAEHIEDNPHNRTRFLVIGNNEPARTGRDKTSLMFNLRNKPGELYRALGALDKEGVNLLLIESRPVPRSSFEYLFFIDCIGHRNEDSLKNAIEALKDCALEITVLGSYPTTDHTE